MRVTKTYVIRKRAPCLSTPRICVPGPISTWYMLVAGRAGVMIMKTTPASAAEDRPYAPSLYSPHSLEHIRLYLSETVGHFCKMSNNVGLAYHKLPVCATQQLTRGRQPVRVTFLSMVAPRLDRTHKVVLSQLKIRTHVLISTSQ